MQPPPHNKRPLFPSNHRQLCHQRRKSKLRLHQHQRRPIRQHRPHRQLRRRPLFRVIGNFADFYWTFSYSTRRPFLSFWPLSRCSPSSFWCHSSLIRHGQLCKRISILMELFVPHFRENTWKVLCFHMQHQRSVSNSKVLTSLIFNLPIFKITLKFFI